MSIDVVSFGETMFRLTAQPGERLEDTPALRVFVGGTESNTLACLGRLDMQVKWLSALPANPLGKHVELELQRHHIDTSAVIWSEGNSRLGIFYAEDFPEPLGQHVYYDRANSACALVDPDEVDYSSIDEARLLHLTGITPALSASAKVVFQRFLERARQKDIPLSFDVNYRARLWSIADAASYLTEACQQARILFCSRDDAIDLWGISGQPEEMLQQLARRFNPQGQEKTIVLTLGSDGSAHLHNGTYQHVPIIPSSGSGRIGSGDAFDGGYLYAYLNGPLYQELSDKYNLSALHFGNACSALKRCVPSDIASSIKPEDVRNALLKHERARFR